MGKASVSSRQRIVFFTIVVWISRVALIALAQTSTGHSLPLQVWDYVQDLALTEAQSTQLQEIREAYETARAGVAGAALTNTPPDAQLAARLNLNDRVHAANRALGELLTEAQQRKLAELRKARGNPRPAAPSKMAQRNDGAAEDKARSMLFTARKPPRPEISEAERRTRAAELRQAYAQPPNTWPAPHIDPEVKPYFQELGLLPLVTYPTNNPYREAKAELGKRLFFDPRLSGSRQISCASCHDPDLAFADGRTVSFGHNRRQLKRNAPTLLNTAFNMSLFWDGRATSLEQQAVEVINNADEMSSNAEIVHDMLKKVPAYTKDFAAAFGSPEITLSRAGQAIATFERTLTSRGNNFDSFLRGDTSSLTDAAVRGLHLFRTAARCVNCHHGPNFTDNRFHNEGLTYYGRKYEDLGRYEATKNPADVGKFKTPTLRNIARTAPYMHQGLFDLDGVLNMYNAGMPAVRPKPGQEHDPRFPVKSPLLQPLGLNQQDLSDLGAFLESLTETRLRVSPPPMYPDSE